MMKKPSATLLRFTWCLLVMAACCCAASAVIASSHQTTKTPQPATQENALEPEAMAALDAMSSYLRSLTAFEVRSTFYRDEVLLSGQKILLSGTSQATVKFPNKLFSEVRVSEKERNFAMYFNGQTLTLYGKKNHYYASVPAPGDLKDLVLTTFAQRGIELPLQDLFLWGTNASNRDAITTAMVIGETTLNSLTCTHYAYRQADVDWQIWVRKGKRPLPLQLVITTTSEASQPQYAARLHWNLNPDISDDLFSFSPPQDAHAIEFMPSSAQLSNKTADGKSAAPSTSKE